MIGQPHQKATVSEMEGVVAIFVCKLGHVIETCADFDKSGYGGFTLREAQKIRAKRGLIGKVVRAYCSPNLTDNIEEYTYERIFNDLVSNGAKVHFEYIGHKEPRE